MNVPGNSDDPLEEVAAPLTVESISIMTDAQLADTYRRVWAGGNEDTPDRFAWGDWGQRINLRDALLQGRLPLLNQAIAERIRAKWDAEAVELRRLQGSES